MQSRVGHNMIKRQGVSKLEGRLKKVAEMKLKTLGIFGHLLPKGRDCPAAASCGRRHHL